MKTMKKNNKVFLALVVVAALAAVSFAGIALSERSDAALLTEAEMVEGNAIRPGTVEGDYVFFVNEGAPFGSLVFIVPDGQTFTGTLKICSKAADGTFTSYSELKLTGASDVTIGAFYELYGTDVVTTFTIGNKSVDTEVFPAGSYELLKGTVMLGSPLPKTPATTWVWQAGAAEDILRGWVDATAFCGTITAAGGVSVEASYAYGLVLSIGDGDARISGNVQSPNSMLPVDSAGDIIPTRDDCFLILGGTYSVEFPKAFQDAKDKGAVTFFSPEGLFFDSINVTVDEGAVITVGDRPVTVVDYFEIELGSNMRYVWLIADDGTLYTYSGGYATTTAEFSGIPIGNYRMVMGTGTYLYYGSVRVGDASVTISTNEAYGLFWDDSAANFTVNAANDSLDYNMTLFRVMFAFNRDTGEVGVINNVLGTVTFPDSGVAAGNRFILQLYSTADNDFYSFYGQPGNPSTATAKHVVRTTSGALNSEEIRVVASSFLLATTPVSFYVLDPSGDLFWPPYTDPALFEKSWLTVKGEINVLYDNPSHYGLMNIALGNANVEFIGEGIISHGVDPPANSNIFGKLPGMNSNNLVAAVFWTNNTATAKSTYYFTSLENALKLSNNITIVGNYVICEDMVLDNPAFTEINIIIGPGASLTIGCDDHSPKVTIPAKTKVINNSGPGKYEVYNGQAIYDVKPVPPINEPVCDVLITGAKFIYTDLATALNDVSVSGDVLKTLRDATLRRDATVKTGVTLTNPDWLIIIPADKILTVNGTVVSKFGYDIRGTLRINSGTVTFENPAVVLLTGTIDVWENGTLELKNSEIIGGVSGALIIDGTATITGAAPIAVAELIMEKGSLTIPATCAFTVTSIMRIGAMPTLSTGYVNAVKKLDGTITLDPLAYAYVYGAFTVAFVTEKHTEYYIQNELYVTVYVAAASVNVLPMLYGDEFDNDEGFRDVIILNWNNERNLRGLWLSDYPATVVGEAGPPVWTKVYAEFEWKQYEVRLNYLPGINWTINGIAYGGSGVESFNYGTSITVKAFVEPGYVGTPVILKNGAAYTAGTAFTLTENVSFTASGVSLPGEAKKNDGLTLIEILLIIIVIIIAIIAIIIAIRLLRS